MCFAAQGTLMFERQERNNGFRRAQYALYDLKYVSYGDSHHH